ncbi:MAG TPA: class I SAM-dependent methyltransferase [Candidatus Aquicultor sp.]|jgi:ubiquinone/menaquinone biosynthesis C-methylase UbiE
MDSYKVYNEVEVDKWAKEAGLLPDEQHVIREYLDSNAKTVDAGTGGGRIPLALRDLGFTSLYGFDFAPNMIAAARNRDESCSITFDVQDAIDLDYPDEFFSQILYIQQILSAITDSTGRENAVSEAFRILKTGGTAIFSFLCIDYRYKSLITSAYVKYLRAFRGLRGSDRSPQCLPFLKVDDKLNYRALLDGGPYAYWFTVQEAYELLDRHGFDIIALSSTLFIREDKFFNSYKQLAKKGVEGGLYIICTKR